MILVESCRAACERLPDYLERKLPEPDAAALENHLRACAACRLKLSQYRDVQGLLQSALIQPAGADAETSTRLRGITTGPWLKVPATNEPRAEVKAGLGTLAQRFGAAPWWAVSVALHVLVILLASLVTMTIGEMGGEEEIIVVTNIEKRPEAKLDEPEKEKPSLRDILESKVAVPTDPNSTEQSNIVVPPDILAKAEIGDHFETINPDRPDTQSAFGNPDARMFHSVEGNDDPEGGGGSGGDSLMDSLIGVGGSASPGTGGGWGGGNGTGTGIGTGSGHGSFGNRNGGGRKLMVMKHGGNKQTESAVDKALEWLARNQEADGSWKIAKHGGTMADPHIGEVAVTGLGLLAFLGAGHTERVGKYAEVVRKAQDWLISQQKGNGALGVNDSWDGQVNGSGYTNAIAGLALAESYAMARNPRVKEAAQKSLDYSLTVQWNEKHGGWRYGLPSQGHGPNLRGADISVTGWHVMQLKSAKVAGLKLDLPKYYTRVSEFLDVLMSKDKAEGGYASHRYGYDKAHTQPSQANTAIGLLCRLFMGTAPHELSSGADFVLGELPRWDEKNGPVSAPKGACPHYYWYYATLALFQMGGQHWEQWNKALKDMLLQHQRKDGAFDGSWDQLGKDGGPAGRAYTTAMCALCLEVYYRYLPMYR